MQKIDIRPHHGAGQISFGMTKEEVLSAIGTPEISTCEKELTEYRSNKNILTTYSSNNSLVEIGFNKNIQTLTLNNVFLFLDDPKIILLDLAKKNGELLETNGFIVLLNLGITLTGFHDDNEEQKAITVFKQGRWDVMKPFLRKFKLKY